MSYKLSENIRKMREIWNDENEADIYLANNFIINTCKDCFDEIVEFNKFQPKEKRVFFDLKANWQLIRECKLGDVIENISDWLKATDIRYNGRSWMDVKVTEMAKDESAELYEQGAIFSEYITE